MRLHFRTERIKLNKRCDQVLSKEIVRCQNSNTLHIARDDHFVNRLKEPETLRY